MTQRLHPTKGYRRERIGIQKLPWWDQKIPESSWQKQDREEREAKWKRRAAA